VDEWLYRHGIGSRWYVEENRINNRWCLGMDLCVGDLVPTGDMAQELIQMFVRMTCGPLGVNEDNIQHWLGVSTFIVDLCSCY
jgi:hypothetical protein